MEPVIEDMTRDEKKNEDSNLLVRKGEVEQFSDSSRDIISSSGIRFYGAPLATSLRPRNVLRAQDQTMLL